MAISLRLTFQPLSTTPSAVPYTIEVMSTSFDIEQSLNVGSSASGVGVGKVVFNPFSFQKKPDLHSADLWLRCCNGTPFSKVTLTATTGGTSTPFFSFAMGAVAVKTISLSLSESDGNPLETVTFEYGQSAYSVTMQNADGTFATPVASGWSRITNQQLDPSKLGI